MKQFTIILISTVILGSFIANAKVSNISSSNHELNNNINLAYNITLEKPKKLFLLLPIKKPVPPKSSKTLSNKEFNLLNLAIESSKKWKWDKVSSIKKNIKDKTALDLIEWIRYYNGASDLTFSNYLNFIDQKKNWPSLEKIKLNAESKITYLDSPSTVIKFFNTNNPQSGLGKIYLGNAYISIGKKEEGVQLIKQGYVEGIFGRSEQKIVISKFKSFLDTKDHKNRISNLLWNKQYRTAQRIIKFVEKDYQKLYEARIGLISFSGGVDQLIAKVPTSLQNNPGLAHDRINWRIKKGKFDSALVLLEEVNKSNSALLERPDKFWKLKAYSIRKLIDFHRYNDAYRLSVNHGLKTNADIAEAEWMAGWLSFTFLKDPSTAALHFKKIFDVSSRPISKARGSYWLARSYKSLKQNELAQKWFAEASKYNLTFYGQLANNYLNEPSQFYVNFYPDPPNVEQPSANMVKIYNAIYLLNELKEYRMIKTFIWSIAKEDNLEERLRIAKLAKKLNRNDYAVQAGKFIYYDTLIFTTESFPTVKRPEYGKIIFPEQSFIHSVIRQESQFDPRAGSYAGANGLMQLMPYTAKKLSSGLNLKYSKSRLKDDPEYNVILGSAYLDQLLSKYSHSYILTLAAYNAGPSRVTRWIAMYGDPRTSDISSEDWVELIPFKETRNYVQRVMENIQVYEFIENDFKPSDYTLQNNLIHGFSEGTNILKPMSKP